jgi:hypothetical protein
MTARACLAHSGYHPRRSRPYTLGTPALSRAAADPWLACVRLCQVHTKALDLGASLLRPQLCDRAFGDRVAWRRRSGIFIRRRELHEPERREAVDPFGVPALRRRMIA